ncbi:hypothetical protein [Mycoplasmopsis cynos]|uniref:hypothetical protein n=1 Tax=Mycoplasmopsis cynos TaxID=171284 RepID=UPI00220324E7|nr:hypothetical protein [Mycoplasmopsis cynos]UWV83265.1 hypothetical protein NW067_03500 [Mycoplasmopsis cynos]
MEYPNPQLKSNVEIHAKAKFKEKLNILIKEEDILKVLPSDWAEKVKKYNEVFIKIGTFIKTYSLKKGFAQTDNSTDKGRTEELLIYNIYETLRANYEKKIKNLKLEMKKSKEFIEKFVKIKQKGDKKNVEWLLVEVTKILNEFKNAEIEKNKILNFSIVKNFYQKIK